jgi:hypothetical protein
MKVVGIDPAPKKGLTVFDGTDYHVPVSDAARFIKDLTTNSDVLLCWDAPLTGPPLGAVAGRETGRSAFTQRPIEAFFSRASTGYKTSKGISVQPYSGCPHWAISRSLIGLPRVGPFDARDEALPFRLVATDNPPKHRRTIVPKSMVNCGGWENCTQG